MFDHTATSSGFREIPQIMRFFETDHLPDQLKVISQPFCDMAKNIDYLLPDNDEKDACLRKLLEAKDCAVRATL